jgi:hypothetical protein
VNTALGAARAAALPHSLHAGEVLARVIASATSSYGAATVAAPSAPPERRTRPLDDEPVLDAAGRVENPRPSCAW